MYSYLELEQKRLEFVGYLRSKVGDPYRWGGNGPHLYDCSGLMCDGLQQIGVLSSDMTSQNLYKHFTTLGYPDVPLPRVPGQLAFYGNEIDSITHVMAVLETWQDEQTILVGARGGDATTTTLDEAYRRGAHVATVRGSYWNSRLQSVIDPFHFGGLDQ